MLIQEERFSYARIKRILLIQKRPKFSFSAQYGSIINLDSGKDEKTYRLDLEPKVIEELKQNGLVVTGQGYYLRSVNIIGASHTSNNTVTGIAIDKIDSANQNDGTVYSIKWNESERCER